MWLEKWELQEKASEETARCRMKAETSEVILWKVRVISERTVISREVLRVTETFQGRRKTAC